VRLRPRWKDQHRAQPFPKAFRRDVIAVARQGDQPIAQVAKSFGVSESCLQRWLKIADREDGVSGPTSSASASGSGVGLEAENRELRKRAKQLEQENEVLRRATAYFACDVLPKSTRWSKNSPLRRSRVAVTCRVLGNSCAGVLQVAGQPDQPTRLGRRASDQRRHRRPP
jgi:transposase-like protein